MSTDQVSLFLALLAVVAEAAAVALVVVAVARWVRPAAAWPRAALDAVRPVALPLAGAIAVTATLGSLYFSEVADFPPCRLCWFQRIAMYPLAVILPIAAWRRDAGARWYALPLSVAGAGVAAYHVTLERFPSLESGACDPTNPCSTIWVERLGYLTIPAMALSGFAAVAALVGIGLSGHPSPPDADRSDDRTHADAGAAADDPNEHAGRALAGDALTTP